MQTLETIKSRSQAGFTNLMEKAKEQPSEVKTWGVTAGSAIVGALTLTTVASGVLAVVATLAAPIALTVGAVGGGWLGWNYMRNRRSVPPTFTPSAAAPSSAASEVMPVATTSFDEIPVVAETATVAQESALPPTALAPEVDESLILSVEAPPAASTENVTVPPLDQLEAIHGIGPVYAGRLRAAGVHTFADLIALTPDRVREMIGPTQYGQIDAESWIAEALHLMKPSAE